MKLNERNITKLMEDIYTVVEDVLVTKNTLCDRIEFRNGIVLYDVLKVEDNNKTFYVDVNETTNSLTIWVPHYEKVLLMDVFELSDYKKKSIPSLVVYALTRI